MQSTENTMLPTPIGLTKKGEGTTKEITPDQESSVSLEPLKREGLTTLQQLKRSGELLIQSMEKSIEAEDTEQGYNPMPLVETAKALAQTAQTQASLVKVLKEFLK